MSSLRMLMKTAALMLEQTYRTKVLSQSRVTLATGDRLAGITHSDDDHGKAGVRDIRGDSACAYKTPECEYVSIQNSDVRSQVSNWTINCSPRLC